MLILHAIYASENHQTVHIMSPDTDVFILDLRTLPQLGPHTCVINMIGSKRKLVLLQPIYDALGSDVIAVLPGFDAFTGCDITGRFAGKGKKSCWKVFVKARKGVIRAFNKLGQGQCPSDEDYQFLEEFVYHLYQPNTKETSMSRLQWNVFKQSQAEAERFSATHCDIDPVMHDSDVEDDDIETVHHFPYYSDSSDSFLASTCEVLEDDDVDNIVHLSDMEVDCADA